MRIEGHPRVGDIYEQKYGPAKGKRVQLTQFHDAPAHLNRWFSTKTVAHPSSPQMVGSTGSTGVQTLNDRWRLVPQETAKSAPAGLAPIEHMRAMHELFPTTTTAAALGAMEAQQRVRAISEPGLVLDTLIALPHIGSSGLRKIADEAQRIIDGRMEDGVFE